MNTISIISYILGVSGWFIAFLFYYSNPKKLLIYYKEYKKRKYYMIHNPSKYYLIKDDFYKPIEIKTNGDVSSLSKSTNASANLNKNNNSVIIDIDVLENSGFLILAADNKSQLNNGILRNGVTKVANYSFNRLTHNGWYEWMITSLVVSAFVSISAIVLANDDSLAEREFGPLLKWVFFGSIGIMTFVSKIIFRSSNYRAFDKMASILRQQRRKRRNRIAIIRRYRCKKKYYRITKALFSSRKTS